MILSACNFTSAVRTEYQCQCCSIVIERSYVHSFLLLRIAMCRLGNRLSDSFCMAKSFSKMNLDSQANWYVCTAVRINVQEVSSCILYSLLLWSAFGDNDIAVFCLLFYSFKSLLLFT